LIRFDGEDGRIGRKQGVGRCNPTIFATREGFREEKAAAAGEGEELLGFSREAAWVE